MTNFSSLDFLEQDFVLADVVTETKVRVAQKDRNPDATFMGIRLWANGSIYPSQALVTALSLEYTKAKPVVTQKMEKDGVTPAKDLEQKPIMIKTFDTSDSMACGLDVIDTKAWGDQYPQDKPRIICVGVTPKKEAKVDLFKQVGFTEDGTPLNSVLEQGADTFGKKELIPLLKEVYGVEVPEKGYIDLSVVMNYNLAKLSQSGRFFLPKKIARGDKAGQADYVIRENINIYPLVPVPADAPAATSPNAENSVGDAQLS